MLVRGVADGAWWQLMTSAFTHEEVLHIGFNMLALYFLGPMLESVLGRWRFLALYLVSALAGSAAVMLWSLPYIQTLGASGAVFGLMGALAVVALKVQGQLQTVLVWIGLNLAFTFTVSGISWQGHIGGLVGGAVIGAAMVFAPRRTGRWSSGASPAWCWWSRWWRSWRASPCSTGPELGLTPRSAGPVTSYELWSQGHDSYDVLGPHVAAAPASRPPRSGETPGSGRKRSRSCPQLGTTLWRTTRV